MKKILLGLVLGLAAGGAATWWILQTHQPPAPTTGEGEKKSTDAAKNDGRVHLTKEQLAYAGLVLAQPQPAEWRAEVKAFGRVLDPTPLATLLTEMEAARATLGASAKEFQRLQSLHAQDHTASVRAVETATAAFQRDRATLDAMEARLLTGWGRTLVERKDITALAHSLVADEAALVRVDFTAGETLPPEPLRVRVAPLPGNEAPRDTVVIGPAPSADAQAQGVALLVLLRAPVPAAGTALLAWVSGGTEARHGWRLPRSAVLRHEGQSFVFVAVREDTFERRRVELAPPQTDGVMITAGVKAEERVVVTGAQQLLSEELKGANGPE